jgi:hypothetical protein
MSGICFKIVQEERGEEGGIHGTTLAMKVVTMAGAWYPTLCPFVYLELFIIKRKQVNTTPCLPFPQGQQVGLHNPQLASIPGTSQGYIQLQVSRLVSMATGEEGKAAS